MSLLFFVTALLSTILLSFLPEHLLKPKAAKKSLKSGFLQSLIVTLMFLVLTLIVQRPIFSGIAIIVFLFILVIVSNTKYQTLREPLVFSDIAMFSQAFKHPRLYFPFLGLAPLILAPLIIIALIYTVLTLEPALSFTWQRISATLTSLVLLWFLLKKQALGFKLSLKPEEDNAQYGLLNTLCIYAFQANTEKHKSSIEQVLTASPFFCKGNTDAQNITINNQPNITVIQSESFFDARRLHPSIKQSILKNYDKCKHASLQYGKLNIPAWGANTMRSEFSFLTGISSKQLGLYQYYPYQYISKMPLYTIASHLKEAGYYCVCIHPHAASFFGRHRVFPQMGFDEFIDINSFDENQTVGPYLSDQAVTDKIIETTKNKTDKPLFIFAITMENHGPLHLEKVAKSEYETYFNKDPKQLDIDNISDLTVYLRHLKNADNMVEGLTQYYSLNATETILCFYGDHVPSMPEVYESTQYSDDSSDYLIWSSNPDKQKTNSIDTDMNIENLAELLR